MYSQSDEERVIHELLGTESGTPKPYTPAFIDIGAADGVTFSNTRELLDHDYFGVLIEPSPFAVARMAANLNQYQSQTRLIAGLIDFTRPEGSLAPFYESPGDMISTTEQSELDRWNSDKSDRNLIHVPVVRIARAIEGVDRSTIEMVNIDTEGTSERVLTELLDLLDKMTRLQVVCVEPDCERDRLGNWSQAASITRITNRLTAKGFAIVHKTSDNLIAHRKV